MKKLIEIFKKNKIIYQFFIYLNLKRFQLIAYFIPDSIYVKWQYRIILGKKLNLKNPVTFTEKIQWLKLNWKDEVLTVCADKYKVRDYVRNRIGEEILTKFYGVYVKVEDIILDDLPASFILKVTHGSGQNIICKNKNDIDWNYTFKLLKIFMANNHYYCGREFAYKNIIPHIICEEYLGNENSVPVDYKFFCFNGEPRFVQVDFGRFTKHERNFYDMNWKPLPVRWSCPHFEGSVNKPQCFEEMCQVTRKLSQGLIFVRVDLYSVNGKVYFGEMTFYPTSGYPKLVPSNYDYIFGSYLQLPDQV